jgi:alpha-galactosidase
VIFLNYTNPMAILTWAMNRASKIKTYGLCHSVQGTAEQLAEDIGVPMAEINYFCAGINHMAFYLKFERNGEDLYPLIHKVVEEGRVPSWNRVRYDVFKRLGYFITESSEHFSEYTPWFIKHDRPDLVEAYNIPLDEYIHRCEEQIAEWGKLRANLEAGQDVLEVAPSKEYAPLMIHSMETGEARVVNANVLNRGLIDNLPQDCCVEVPCVVDKNGISPVKVGALPPQLAAVIQTNINVQSLTVEAALTLKRSFIYQAAMMDPHTAAELSLDQIWSLVDDLIEAHGSWLPEYH